ncbi:sorbosone dehydrogenase family protein [Pelomonas sp. KK5]|uniref:PQQ-dependent sugar dehydrogenase n=1 Tax=Pelomonas sp. KK5 TaxID=1855730 RepID=UPI0009FA3B91|nr:PQQ-dependent sugar dehydrogenase [Pelomonas sp. KK5]
MMPTRPSRLAALLLAAFSTVPALAIDATVVTSGLDVPLMLTAPAGDSRSFIVEKGGLVKVLVGGVVQPTPFLDLSAQVATDGERGLLGLSFDPNYATNGRFYVDYVDKTTLNTVIARYQVASPGASVADAGSAQQIMTIAQPAGRNNHKAGWIGFRPGDTNNLYIATGDGGSGYDPDNNAQNPQSLLGKILRVDVSGTGAGYAVPADNPFSASATTRPEIWALGLRNPFRASFDRASGAFWIGDVGQSTREELDLELAGDPGGHNYGWRLREGTIQSPTNGGNAPGLTGPVYDYGRDMGGTVIGGFVYRGPSIADADGRYFFGDYVANKVWSFAVGAGGALSDLRDDTAALLGGTGLSGLDAFGEDSQGRLYAMGTNGVLVVVVDEPATAMSLAGGLAVLAGFLFRRRGRGRA